MAIDGNLVVGGAPEDDEPLDSGSVYIYDLAGLVPPPPPPPPPPPVEVDVAVTASCTPPPPA